MTLGNAEVMARYLLTKMNLRKNLKLITLEDHCRNNFGHRLFEEGYFGIPE
jgi:hypothetical protein